MEINQERINAAYAVANEEQRKVLDALLGENKVKDNRPVTERINTFEDAVNELGKEHPLVKSCANFDALEGEEDVEAYLKLRIVVAAFNEGWSPKFVKGEARYYPYYILYTKEEVEEMDDSERKELLIVGSAANSGSLCGVSCCSSSPAFSLSYVYVGARLAFKSRELAKCAGRKFFDLYAKFMFNYK